MAIAVRCYDGQFSYSALDGHVHHAADLTFTVALGFARRERQRHIGLGLLRLVPVRPRTAIAAHRIVAAGIAFELQRLVDPLERQALAAGLADVARVAWRIRLFDRDESGLQRRLAS
jgi:hypothetical protein